MTIQYSTTLRDNQIDEVEPLVTAGTLEIRTGAQPANCAAADTGTVLATIVLPADCFSVPSAGAITKNGTWSDASADATGTAAHFRMKSSGAAVHMQGSVGQGSGDLSLNNTSIVSTQQVDVTTFTITRSGA